MGGGSSWYVYGGSWGGWWIGLDWIEMIGMIGAFGRVFVMGQLG